jgi:hypothetical protein
MKEPVPSGEPEMTYWSANAGVPVTIPRHTTNTIPQVGHRPIVRPLGEKAPRETPSLGRSHPMSHSRPVFAMGASEDAGIIGTRTAFYPCPLGQQRESEVRLPRRAALGRFR